MALSPGVYTKETDMTFNIASITSNAAGYVGMFSWGPAMEITTITTDKDELQRRFGIPTIQNTGFFHAAANYLLYAAPLSIVRCVGNTAVNAIADDSIVEGGDPDDPELLSSPTILNTNEYQDATLTGYSVIGRYPGSYVNGVTVSMANSEGVAQWAYAGQFMYSPQDEDTYNIVVIDTLGQISGNAGTILERYELMKLTPGSKKTDGTSAYLRDAVENQSNYILFGDLEKIEPVDGVYEVTLVEGKNDEAVVDLTQGWDLFSSSDEVEIIRTFNSFGNITDVIRCVDVMESRGDSIAFASPPLYSVYNTQNQVTNLKQYWGETVNRSSSYMFKDDNWKMVRDSYNDMNLWIPTDSDAAGLHARTFVDAEPWYSHAGFNRGHMKNVIRLAWSSNAKQRDELYPAGINSFVSFKGDGIILYGDRTALTTPSAFSRINVRTLFIVIKKAIAHASRGLLFEFNDYITQSLFRNATNRYLTDVQGRRGITAFRVVCDSSNNTPQVIDNNEFRGDVYVAPNRSINFIHLNFIATATGGVEFEEIENSAG